MIQRIQKLPRRQRQIIFVLLFGGGLLLIGLITLALILLSLNTGGRDQSVALMDGVTVREFAALPDDDAYPAAVAVAADGTVYTGSFVSGAVWSVAPDGTVSELPGTREAIGAVAGLAPGPDGSLYVVDQGDADPLTLGGEIKRIAPDGEISTFATPGESLTLLDDVTLDAEGNIYVSDRGQAAVWRFDPDGSGEVWWVPPAADAETSPAPTGLAYDPTTESIIVTDSTLDTLYRVATSDGETDLLYDHAGGEFAPGFDGVTVGTDGQIYVAALAQNGLVVLRDGELEYLAGVFRGISDVAFHDNRIYATNFDSFSLVISPIRPRLPFALDVIELAGE